MTITARNRLIKGGAAASAFLSLSAAAAFIRLCRNAELRVAETLTRFVELPDHAIFASSFYAAAYAALALAATGTIALLRIYFLFEKTPSIEITFFSAGLIAVSAECIRIFAPLFSLWERHPVMLVLISRAVLFARVFFVLAFLSAAIFSLEKTMQKSGTLLFFIGAAAFFTAESMPINCSSPSSAFLLMPGYSGLLLAVIALLLLIAFFSFLIQAKTRDMPEYGKTAAGCLCTGYGWILLGACDNWAFLVAGTALLAGGTAIYVQSLHQHYLWQ